MNCDILGSSVTSQWREGAVRLDWRKVFSHQRSSLVYSIAVGSRDGYSDLLHRIDIDVTSITVDVERSLTSVYVVIKANADNGRFVIYSTNVIRH